MKTVQLSEGQSELLMQLLLNEMTRLYAEQNKLMASVGLQAGVPVRWQSHVLDLREQSVLTTIRKLVDEA